MTNAEQFFYDNAGYSYTPVPVGTPNWAKKTAQAKKEGRLLGAKALAEAEAYAKRHDLVFEWEEDQDGCIGCECGSAECSCCSGEPHETLCCILRDQEPS